MLRACLVVCVLVGAQARRGGHSHSHSHGHGGGYGGGHSYPASHGYSGTHNTHHASQAATYPHSTGLSGNSNSGGHTYHKTEVHHHYYSPPQHISYGTGYHPVYQQRPPIYVYAYRDSGSRFDTLLTGLALYNLGRMSAHSHHYSDSQREYRTHPGEMCKMQIVKNTGEYEETRIDCKLMSSFIWEADSKQQQQSQEHSVVSTNTVTVTKTEDTSDGNKTVTTTTNTTVKDALQVKGPSIEVVPGMKCYMIRVYQNYSTLKKEVECGLLQAYAVNSFRNNSCRNVPALVLVLLSSTIFPFLYR